MVQILENNKRPSSSQQFAAGINQAFPGVEQYLAERKQENQFQKENEALKRQTGQDLSGIRDPAMRNMLIANELTQGKKKNLAENSQKSNLSPYSDEKNSVPKKGGISTKSNELTEADRRRTRPTLTVQELIDQAKQNAEAKGTNVEDEYNTLTTINQDAQLQNDKIKQSQLEYGDKYLNKVGKVIENMDDDEKAIFQRKGEVAYSEGKTEAEIAQEASKDAIQYSNSIDNLKQTLKNINPINYDKKSNELKLKVQPLLDLGLNDKAREILNNGGLYPEQTEKIVSSLGENAKKTLTTFPKMERPSRSWWESQKFDENTLNLFSIGYEYNKSPYSPEQKEIIRNNIKDVFTNEPNANIVLLREQYLKDKDIEWDEFKDSLEDLALKGEIKLNDDQFKQLNVIKEPPLSGLEKILKNLRIF